METVIKRKSFDRWGEPILVSKTIWLEDEHPINEDGTAFNGNYNAFIPLNLAIFAAIAVGLIKIGTWCVVAAFAL